MTECGFCGKRPGDVFCLIVAESGESICNECVDVCLELVYETRVEAAALAAMADPDPIAPKPKLVDK
jgi:ATP-dependent protease Clp ATPase subunit